MSKYSYIAFFRIPIECWSHLWSCIPSFEKIVSGTLFVGSSLTTSTNQLSQYMKLWVRLDTTYFAENWKYCSKIIFKRVDNTVKPNFNESFVEKKRFVGPVQGTHWNSINALLQKKKKGETLEVEHRLSSHTGTMLYICIDNRNSILTWKSNRFELVCT